MHILILILIISPLALSTITKKQQNNNNLLQPIRIKFPSILWTYLPYKQNNATQYQKLNYYNLKYYAQRSGLDFRAVYQDGVKQVLGEDMVRRLDVMVKKNQRIVVKNYHYIVSLMLLFKHGGIYTSATNIFLTDFKTILRQKQLFNKMTLKANIILLTFDQKYAYKTPKQRLQYPGILADFIVCDKENQLIGEWIGVIQEIISTGYPVIVQRARKNNFFIPYAVIGNDDVMFSTYAPLYVLHRKKQQILSNNISLQAVQYYKIWTIDVNITLTSIFIARRWQNHIGLIQLLRERSVNILGNIYPKQKGLMIVFVQAGFLKGLDPFISKYYLHKSFNKRSPIFEQSIINKHLFEAIQHKQMYKYSKGLITYPILKYRANQTQLFKRLQSQNPSFFVINPQLIDLWYNFGIAILLILASFVVVFGLDFVKNGKF